MSINSKEIKFVLLQARHPNYVMHFLLDPAMILNSIFHSMFYKNFYLQYHSFTKLSFVTEKTHEIVS